MVNVANLIHLWIQRCESAHKSAGLTLFSCWLPGNHANSRVIQTAFKCKLSAKTAMNFRPISNANDDRSILRKYMQISVSSKAIL